MRSGAGDVVSRRDSCRDSSDISLLLVAILFFET